MGHARLGLYEKSATRDGPTTANYLILYRPPIPVGSQQTLSRWLSCDKLTGSKGQVPSLTCTSIQRAGVEVAGGEEVERGLRIDNGKIRIEDTLPSSRHPTRRRHSILRKVYIPLFLDELLVPSQGRERHKRNHVDAWTGQQSVEVLNQGVRDIPLDVLWIAAKVSCMIDLVLKQLASLVEVSGEQQRLLTMPVTLLPMKLAG